MSYKMQPKKGEFWLVKYWYGNQVMLVRESLELSWFKCGDDRPISNGVVPIRRIRMK